MQKILLASLLLYGHMTVAQTPPADALQPCLQATHAEPVAFEPCQRAISETIPGSVARARAHAAMAIQHARVDDLARARDAIDEALSIAPDNADVQGNLGVVLLREGDYLAAVNAFNNMLGNDPATLYNPALYLNRSLALRALGRYDEAAKDYVLYLDLITQPASPSSQTPVDAPEPQPYSDSST